MVRWRFVVHDAFVSVFDRFFANVIVVFANEALSFVDAGEEEDEPKGKEAYLRALWIG